MTFDRDFEREQWQPPEDILDIIEIQPNSTFIDVGCGDGYFTIPAAKRVAPHGRVLAIDVNTAALTRLQEKANREHLTNLEVTTGMAEDHVLCKGCGDIVFFGINLHDFTSAAKVLQNARRMLKPSGKLVNLDWKKKPMRIGPPLHIRFSQQEAIDLIKGAEFYIVRVQDIGPYHYLIIAHPL
ncbi:MAG: class I SAM-dependent methyltransferase [Candidatus Bathyarchaeota archaeon]|nr:class I SAM-dependent methyltransferase [Candidatus Bathyarchaeota archaeon]